MESRKLILLLLPIGMCLASHHSHIIPVEGYDTELHNLGEHVEIPETPVKLIKITKTVAVKIPVPYPVKVVEKVPYPVHINKPYPVPVPQIVKVPYAAATNGPHKHQELDIGDREGNYFHNNPDSSYQVQENIEHNDLPNSNKQDGHSYNGPTYGGFDAPVRDEYVEGSPSAYNQPQRYFSPESESSNIAIQNYLNNLNSKEKNEGLNNYSYH